MSLLYEGRLKNGTNYEVKSLSLAHLTKILQLQTTVYESIENKAQLAQLTEEEYQYILTGKGLMLGVFVAKELIALRALLIPKLDDSEHLGLDVGLSAEQLKEVIYQEISLVHPNYRGNRLQQQLAKHIMIQLSQQKHTYRYVCCTVAPFNLPSLIDKFKQGLYVKALKYKYEDQLRYIFLKDLQKDFPIEAIEERQEIPLKLIEKQQHLLAKGWVGIALRQKKEDWVMTYVKI